MIINHNITALNTHRQLVAATNAQSKSMEKLASGLRINRAGDDAAGLAISEKMRGQIRGLDIASKNSQDGISMIQTAEAALNEVHDIFQRQRELAVQSSSDTNVAADSTALKDEFDQLTTEVKRISSTTQFNTQNLLDKSAGTAGVVKLHIGANKDQVFDLKLDTAGIDLSAVNTALAAADISDQTKSQTATATLDTQIASVSSGRSYLGAAQNRLEHTIKNLQTSSENL
jgi:flagellin